MGTVCEVTKLSFPKTKSVRVGLGVTLLETKDSILGKMRVSGDKTARAVLLSDRIDRNVRSVSVLVPYVSVSMREGSALYILT